ncbi:hypothetical protein LMG26689_02613 [Achromobacter animicus]|uniref:Bug family tripartite tricarboxylate transporter substrate binding protein n=1 Tax=Achromobacter animicus TaxID=1389935 RepID=UPI00146517E6|nr:tripartite tricarboxylate transporter substrate binding protein [Achromobacter animicus]CAB3863471.1 hypothetical protein LMG26689_02613 [Achromobacter animicus]
MKRLLITMLLAAFTLPAVCADFPSAPIRLVVPYAPGGPVDVLARAIGPAMSAALKQSVVVENRTGANEIVAAEYVAKSPPDGLTLFVATDAALTMNPHLYKKLNYEPMRDFTPVTQLVSIPMVVLASPTLPVNTMADLLSLAKEKPGTLAYGSSGLGGITHIPMSMFEKQNDIQLLHVPYKGAGQLTPDLIAGNIELSLLAVSVVEQYVKSGRMKAIAVSAPKRVSALPEVPTFTELGLKDIGGSFFIGLVAPAGTPKEIVDRLSGLTHDIITAPEFRAKYLDPYAYEVVGSSPTDFKAFLQTQLSQQAERIRISGAKME